MFRKYSGGNFMAIRFFSDLVRVLSIGLNPIQVLLIRSDPVRVLSVRSDPIRSRFCKRPSQCGLKLSCNCQCNLITNESWQLVRNLGNCINQNRYQAQDDSPFQKIIFSLSDILFHFLKEIEQQLKKRGITKDKDVSEIYLANRLSLFV